MVRIHFRTLGFGPSKVLHTSHFKTLEAYFPEHLDRMPRAPFKINDSCLLQGFGDFAQLFLWTLQLWTSAHGLLIWTVPGISLLKDYNFLLLLSPKWVALNVTLCVHGYGLREQGFGQLAVGWENRETSD
jgi:hypothetical protein